VTLPSAVQALLAENGVDLAAALRADGLDVKRAALPAGAPAPEGKEVMLVLAAAGLGAALLSTGIVKIIDALGRNKKVLVTEHELVPVLDNKGNPVKHKGGEPVMYWKATKRLIEAKQTAQGKGAIEAEVGPTMLKFSVKSG
jgi:hypothetical protein